MTAGKGVDMAEHHAHLQPFQFRVVDEKRELDAKLQDLWTFLGSETFRRLPVAERRRLTRQSQHMQDYSMVLGERIEAFEGGST